MTEFERRQLIAIRNELDRAHAERTAPAVNANFTASPTRFIQQESDLTGTSSRTVPAALPPTRVTRFWQSSNAQCEQCNHTHSEN
jgi:hypothetical protein